MDLPIVDAAIPQELVFPLCQHIGAPNQPLVEVGQRVLRGQKLADTDARICAPIHSSVSGQVTAIERRPNALGQETMSVVVTNDGLDEQVQPLSGAGDFAQLTSEQIVSLVREAGIVGMGGAGFPTHIKLTPRADQRLEAILLNGAECEPYLTGDYRVMLEMPAEVVLGLRIVMKATGVDKGYIGVELNKAQAIAALEAASSDFPEIEVVPLQTKYPQGSETQLIKAIVGKELPTGKYPPDLGVAVINVSTAAAVAAAVSRGQPLLERVVTVSGSMVEHPQNLRVRLGTSFSEVLTACGLSGQPGKVIQGGPLMGTTCPDPAAPVTKVTNGILALSAVEAAVLAPSPCIRCARCVDACSMRLQPLVLAQLAERGMVAEAEAENVLDCRECGCCSYICPARRPLLQSIRLAKNDVLAQQRS